MNTVVRLRERETVWTCDSGVCSACHEELAKVDVEYCCLPGWNCSTEHVRQFSDLATNAQAFVIKIEQLVGVHGQLLSSCKQASKSHWVGTIQSTVGRGSFFSGPDPTRTSHFTLFRSQKIAMLAIIAIIDASHKQLAINTTAASFAYQ